MGVKRSFMEIDGEAVQVFCSYNIMTIAQDTLLSGSQTCDNVKGLYVLL